MKRWTKIVGTASLAVVAFVGLTAASSAAGLGAGAAGPGGAGKGPTIPAAVAAADANTVPAAAAAQFAPAHTEDTYVPIAPCRIVDTRSAAAGQGALQNNYQRDYYVAGTANFPAQGGNSGGCGIPYGATAVAATFTAITPSAAGFLRAWPTGTTAPNATFTNFQAKMNSSTGGTVSVLPTSSGKMLTVKDFGGTIDLVIDVSGYYIPPIEGLVSPDGTAFSGTPRIIKSAKISTGVYQVTVDTDVSYCTPLVNPYPGTNLYATARNYNGTNVTVSLWQITNGVVAPVDSYFYLYVAC